MDQNRTPREFVPPQRLQDHLRDLFQQIVFRLSTFNQQIVIIQVFDGVNAAIRDYMDPEAHVAADPQLYIGDLEGIQGLMNSVDAETQALIAQFVTGAADQLRWMNARPAAQNLDEFLDNLTNTNAASMTSTSPESATLACTICLDAYLADDTVVVLPCHATHHFHRRCIKLWFEELSNQARTCPSCRAEVRQSAQ